MTAWLQPSADESDDDLVPAHPSWIEGVARVVALEGELAWLEPEQTTTCGSCAAAGHCGGGSEGGLGTTASRLALRRFALLNTDHFRVGERLVVGVSARALLRAAVTAYILPLVTLFLAGGSAQWLVGRDVVTLIAAVVGLVVGLVAARGVAYVLTSTGQLAPCFLRRASADPASCQLNVL